MGYKRKVEVTLSSHFFANFWHICYFFNVKRDEGAEKLQENYQMYPKFGLKNRCSK